MFKKKVGLPQNDLRQSHNVYFFASGCYQDSIFRNSSI